MRIRPRPLVLAVACTPALVTARRRQNGLATTVPISTVAGLDPAGDVFGYDPTSARRGAIVWHVGV